MITYIKGICLGVKIEVDPDYEEPQITVLVEDDENWIETDCQFSAYWLEDLIRALTSAKDEVGYDKLVEEVNAAIAAKTEEV